MVLSSTSEAKATDENGERFQFRSTEASQVVPNDINRAPGLMRDAISGVMVTLSSLNGPNWTVALIFLLIHFSSPRVSITSPRGTKPISSSWMEPNCDLYRAARYKSSIGFNRYCLVPCTNPEFTSN